MEANPLLGVILIMVGGLTSASFYIPFSRVKKWSWETYWLVNGVFSWIIAPWVLAICVSPDLYKVITETPPEDLLKAYLFGAMWGVGGLSFGLAIRYLGLSLGVAMALGYCAAFGTLMPPIFDHTMMGLLATASGKIILVGVGVCLGGIALTGMAGMSKEREMSDEKKKDAVKEFSFMKGILVATFAGIMSAGMSFGFAAGKPIADLAVHYKTPDMLQDIPVLCVILAGGFTTNFIWCVLLNIKNGSGKEYFDFSQPGLWLANAFFCAVAGVTWYLQFFFYGMGRSTIGDYKFSSWTVLMASIIVFSTCWGILLKEWKGCGRRTYILLTPWFGRAHSFHGHCRVRKLPQAPGGIANRCFGVRRFIAALQRDEDNRPSSILSSDEKRR